MKKLSIGMVLYNPKVQKLLNNINELNIIADKIYLIDNNSNNIDKLEEKINNDKIILVKNKDNLGIARGLNQLLEETVKNKDELLLTLDQDSMINPSMILEMINYISDDIAIVCPVINDINKKKKINQEKDIVELERCITSGSIMNLCVCKNIGVFDEKMFIDYVDFDYCKRIRLENKKIIMVKNAVLEHEIGKRTKKKFLFWAVYPTNHNEKRVYYYVRNIKYFCKKYKLTFKEILYEKIVLTWKFISIILYENNKKNKIRAFINGLKDYKTMLD